MGDADDDQLWYHRGWVRERTRSQTARARGARGTPRGRGSYRPRQYTHRFSYRNSGDRGENGEPKEEPEGPPPPQDFCRRDDGRTPYVHDPTNALERSRPAGHSSTEDQSKVDPTVDDDEPLSSTKPRSSDTTPQLEGGRQSDDRRSDVSDRPHRA